MGELFKGIVFLGIGVLIAYFTFSKRGRAYLGRTRHFRGETGWAGWVVFAIAAGMTSTLVGLTLLVHSIIKMLR